MTDRESKIEKDFVTYARGLGCLVVKLAGKGWPDRMLIVPGNRFIFIEFKTDKGRVSLHQNAVHASLRAKGCLVWVVSGKQSSESHKMFLKRLVDDETSLV